MNKTKIFYLSLFISLGILFAESCNSHNKANSIIGKWKPIGIDASQTSFSPNAKENLMKAFNASKDTMYMEFASDGIVYSNVQTLKVHWKTKQ